MSIKTGVKCEFDFFLGIPDKHKPTVKFSEPHQRPQVINGNS